MARRTHFRYPGGWKILWGVAAYVVGYLGVFLWKGDQVGTAMARTTVETRSGTATVAELVGNADVTVPAWKGAGWLFYNAHFVDVSVPTELGGIAHVNLVTGAGGTFLGLFAVAGGALIAAGYLTTVGTTDPVEFRFDFGTGTERFAVNGALLALFGYLPCWLAGPFLFGVGPYSFVGLKFLWLGILLPLGYGAGGGLLAGLVTDRQPAGEGSDEQPGAGRWSE